MKNVIIIGARGWGRELHGALCHQAAYGKEFVIKGFLDDKFDALADYEGYAPILDSVEHYTPEDDDLFICALGNPCYRRKYAEMILEKGGRFMSIVSPTAIINPKAKIGQGVIISAYCCVSSEVVIGDFASLQAFCIVGHDASIGKWSALESSCFMGGGSSVGEGALLHTRSTILPGVSVGDGATVGAGAVCVRKVKAGTTVYGNPAVRLKY